MTRAHVADPPPHLAAAYHRHTCPVCQSEYACYGPNHTPDSARPCGSAVCKKEKP